jgi:hypothetical protein
MYVFRICVTVCACLWGRALLRRWSLRSRRRHHQHPLRARGVAHRAGHSLQPHLAAALRRAHDRARPDRRRHDVRRAAHGAASARDQQCAPRTTAPPPHQQLHPAAPIPTPFHPTPFHPTPFHPTPELAVERGRLLLHSADGLRWNLEGEWSSLAMGSAVSSSNEIVGVEASPLRRRRLGVHAHRGAIAADSSRHGGGGGLAEVSLSTSDPVVWTVALRPASAAPATAAPAAAAASR